MPLPPLKQLRCAKLKEFASSRLGRSLTAVALLLGVAGAVSGIVSGVTGCGRFFISQYVHVTTTSLPDGTVNVSYSQTVAATGGFSPYTWTVSSGTLPDGLSINSTTGAITGIPSTSGPSTFIVTATDQNGDVGTASLTLTIDAGASLTVTTTSLPDGTVGTAYSETVTASGGTPPYTWSLTSGSLPPGLTGTMAGAISGKPTTAGAYPFTAEVTDSADATASANLTITVDAASGAAGGTAPSNAPAEDRGR